MDRVQPLIPVTDKLWGKCICLESQGQEVPKLLRWRQNYSGTEKERNLMVPEWEKG